MPPHGVLLASTPEAALSRVLRWPAMPTTRQRPSEQTAPTSRVDRFRQRYGSDDPEGDRDEPTTRQYTTQTKQPEDLGERTVRFIASTAAEDRDSDVVIPEGIRTDAYSENPTVLFGHRHGELPVGRAVDTFTRQGEFIVDVQFDEDDRSDLVYQKVQQGSLNAVSIGFKPITIKETEDVDGFVFEEVELLEISVVTVPSNPEAVAVLREFKEAGFDVELKEGRTLSQKNVDRLQGAMVQIDEVLAEQGEDAGLSGGEDQGTHPDEEMDAPNSVAKALDEPDRLELEGIVEGITAQIEAIAQMLGDDAPLTTRREQEMAQNFDALGRRVERAEAIVDIEEGGDGEMEATRSEQSDRDEGDDEQTEEGEAPDQTKMATEFQDLPLAARDREWDSEAAEGRWRGFSGSTEGPSDSYRDNFLWVDSESPETFGSYKLPYGDIIDGSHVAVPRGIFAVAAALEGARGGVDIPESDVLDVQAHVERYYQKMRDEFEDDNLVAPWNAEESADDGGEEKGEGKEDENTDEPEDTEDEKSDEPFMRVVGEQNEDPEPDGEEITLTDDAAASFGLR